MEGGESALELAYKNRNMDAFCQVEKQLVSINVENHQEMYQKVANIIVTDDEATYFTVLVDQLAK